METIETYRNGELVEVRENDSFTTNLPNISGFISQMLINESYNRLAFTSNNQVARSRLEIAITRLELKSEITASDLVLLKTIWNMVSESTPGLTANDLSEWNRISAQNYMPFIFTEDFKMQLT